MSEHETIDEATFADGAINAVNRMLTAKMGVGTEAALQTKAITYAILELAENVGFLTRELKKQRGKTS